MMNMPIKSLCLAAILLSFLQPTLAIELSGSGRALTAPFFKAMSEKYRDKTEGVIIKYTPSKLEAGLADVESAAIDFYETDIPLAKTDLDKRGLTQFPYMASGIVPVFHLPSIRGGQLSLTGGILADIFLGKITKWNDPAIVGINPSLKLPDAKINLVYWSSTGGGTSALNNYLAKASPVWAAKVKPGIALNSASGTQVDDLAGMKSHIKSNAYSLGYADIAYARANGLDHSKLQNKMGVFASAQADSVAASLTGITWSASNNFNEDLIDRAGKQSWPITTAGYIIIKKTSSDIPRRVKLLSYLSWTLKNSGWDLSILDFNSLPKEVLPLIHNAWNDTPLTIANATVVTAAQARILQEEGALLIDTRVEKEYHAEHIVNAISLVYGEKSIRSAEFDSSQDSFNLKKLPQDKNAKIIFYCNAGACWRGYKAAVVASKAGYNQIYWFRGGIPEWIAKRYPVEASLTAHTKR